jgi:hypothetical protein
MRRAIVVALVVVCAGCGGSSPTSKAPTVTRRAAPAHVVDHLTAVRLRAWAARLRVCYRERELAPGRVTVSQRRLTIDVDPSVPPSILTGEMLACASTLGRPPGHASLRSRRGRTVVLLPAGFLLTGS